MRDENWGFWMTEHNMCVSHLVTTQFNSSQRSMQLPEQGFDKAWVSVPLVIVALPTWFLRLWPVLFKTKWTELEFDNNLWNMMPHRVYGVGQFISSNFPSPVRPSLQLINQRVKTVSCVCGPANKLGHYTPGKTTWWTHHWKFRNILVLHAKNSALNCYIFSSSYNKSGIPYCHAEIVE